MRAGGRSGSAATLSRIAGSSTSAVITASISARTPSARRARSGVAKSGESGKPGAASDMSATLVFGCALLGEGAWPFLGVLAREHFPADLVLVLHGVVVAHVLGLAPRLQDRHRRERRVLGDLLGHGLGDVERGAVGNDAA